MRAERWLQLALCLYGVVFVILGLWPAGVVLFLVAWLIH